MPHALLTIVAAALSLSAAELPSTEIAGSEGAAPPSLRVSVLEGRNRREITIDTVTGATTRAASSRPTRVAMALPGSDLSAELQPAAGGARHDLFIVQRNADGTERRRAQVCGRDEDPRHVAWHQGWQRLIYVRGVGDAGTLRSRDPRSEQETTIDVGGIVEDVRIGPEDRVAVQVITARRGKERSVDLVVLHGRATLRPVRGESISSFAWMPDGERLVYSVPGEIRIVTIADRSTQTVRLADLDPALGNHISHSIDVAPDGTIALSLVFAGGRASSVSDPQAEPKPLPGDHEVFLLALPDVLRAIPVGGTVAEVRWAR